MCVLLTIFQHRQVILLFDLPQQPDISTKTSKRTEDTDLERSILVYTNKQQLNRHVRNADVVENNGIIEGNLASN